MNPRKVVPIVLLVIGVLLLVGGGSGWMGSTHGMSMGSQEISITTHRSMGFPFWAGAGLIVVAGALLLSPRWLSQRA